MKKIAVVFMTLSIFATTTEVNSATSICNPVELMQPQTSVTDIYNFLVQSLGLSTTQKPVVKKLVDEAGVLTTKLNSDTSMTEAEKSTAKTGIVNDLIKKLGDGVLKSAQKTKLGGLATQLTTMFSALK